MIELASLPTLSTRGPLADRVFAVLRDAIGNGDLPSGYRLRETQLATHFECSSTPIREAIRRLAGDGLVTILPHRGAEVVGHSRQELVELFEVRELLELKAAELAAARTPNTDDVDRLRTLIAQQAAGPTATARTLNAAVHTAFAALSGNTHLTRLVERINVQIETTRTRLNNSVAGGPEQATQSHREWLEIVTSDHPGDAPAFLAEHLALARDAVLDQLSEDYPD